jgi:hypothetical protein
MMKPERRAEEWKELQPFVQGYVYGKAFGIPRKALVEQACQEYTIFHRIRSYGVRDLAFFVRCYYESLKED